MSDAINKIDRGEELANELEEKFAEEKPADVMYAISIIIGRAVALRSIDGDLDKTMGLLRQGAALEMKEPKNRRRMVS